MTVKQLIFWCNRSSSWLKDSRVIFLSVGFAELWIACLTRLERETLSQVEADLKAANLPIEADFHQGSVPAGILDLAKMNEISAIAISAGTLGKFQEWFVSSFAVQLLRQSLCPVLFFPTRD